MNKTITMLLLYLLNPIACGGYFCSYGHYVQECQPFCYLCAGFYQQHYNDTLNADAYNRTAPQNENNPGLSYTRLPNNSNQNFNQYDGNNSYYCIQGRPLQDVQYAQDEYHLNIQEYTKESDFDPNLLRHERVSDQPTIDRPYISYDLKDALHPSQIFNQNQFAYGHSMSYASPHQSFVPASQFPSNTNQHWSNSIPTNIAQNSTNWDFSEKANDESSYGWVYNSKASSGMLNNTNTPTFYGLSGDNPSTGIVKLPDACPSNSLCDMDHNNTSWNDKTSHDQNDTEMVYEDISYSGCNENKCTAEVKDSENDTEMIQDCTISSQSDIVDKYSNISIELKNQVASIPRYSFNSLEFIEFDKKLLIVSALSIVTAGHAKFIPVVTRISRCRYFGFKGSNPKAKYKKKSTFSDFWVIHFYSRFLALRSKALSTAIIYKRMQYLQPLSEANIQEISKYEEDMIDSVFDLLTSPTGQFGFKLIDEISPDNFGAIRNVYSTYALYNEVMSENLLKATLSSSLKNQIDARTVLEFYPCDYLENPFINVTFKDMFEQSNKIQRDMGEYVLNIKLKENFEENGAFLENLSKIVEMLKNEDVKIQIIRNYYSKKSFISSIQKSSATIEWFPKLYEYLISDVFINHLTVYYRIINKKLNDLKNERPSKSIIEKIDLNVSLMFVEINAQMESFVATVDECVNGAKNFNQVKKGWMKSYQDKILHEYRLKDQSIGSKIKFTARSTFSYYLYEKMQKTKYYYDPEVDEDAKECELMHQIMIFKRVFECLFNSFLGFISLYPKSKNPINIKAELYLIPEYMLLFVFKPIPLKKFAREFLDAKLGYLIINDNLFERSALEKKFSFESTRMTGDFDHHFKVTVELINEFWMVKINGNSNNLATIKQSPSVFKLGLYNCVERNEVEGTWCLKSYSKWLYNQIHGVIDVEEKHSSECDEDI